MYMSELPFNPSNLTGMRLSIDKELSPGQEVSLSVKEGGLVHIMRAQVRWVAGMRNGRGELIQRELNQLGEDNERVLGSGNLQDYFGTDCRTYPYLIGVKIFPERYGVDFPELK